MLFFWSAAASYMLLLFHTRRVPTMAAAPKYASAACLLQPHCLLLRAALT
jgi:hypothetical protein